MLKRLYPWATDDDINTALNQVVTQETAPKYGSKTTLGGAIDLSKTLSSFSPGGYVKSKATPTNIMSGLLDVLFKGKGTRYTKEELSKMTEQEKRSLGL
jgi:hypothetical protein